MKCFVGNGGKEQMRWEVMETNKTSVLDVVWDSFCLW